eukprot:TRINITY_DN14821_c0_g1_i2.p1 TRINITY_DN14821_c0_g1~~TRINITY_DN14821_c0_g1_i2.p1  ORF type:complete len:497 (+),score=117.42 TRINITY_DN14821_c0_g1_i2:87-1577(+)
MIRRAWARFGSAAVAKSIPGPPSSAGFGTFGDLIARNGGSMEGIDRKMHLILDDFTREFGPLSAHDWPGLGKFLLCADPVSYQSVYNTEGKYPTGTGEFLWPFKTNYTDRGWGEKYVASLERGEEWWQWRNKLQGELLPPQAARKMLPNINAAVAAAVPHLEHYANDLDTWVSRTALQMFVSAMLGKVLPYADPQAIRQVDKEFIDASQQYFTLGMRLVQQDVPMEKRKEVPYYDAFLQAADLQQEYGLSLVRELKQELEQGGGELQRTCFLARVLEKGVDEQEVVFSLSRLISAGVDTTSYVFCAVILNVATHPEVQQRLREEVLAVAGRDGDITGAHIDQMEYLRAVVRESHRRSPTGQLILKEAMQDIELCGHFVPKGTKVQWVDTFSREERFADAPGEFRPDRFLPSAIAARKGTPQEMLDHKLLRDPFSAGSRMCLGARVAALELAVCLAHVVRRWELKVPSDQSWSTRRLLLLKADPWPRFEVNSFTASP